MKSERRHELQRNALADLLIRWWNDVRQYTPAVAATLAAIAVLATVYLIISTRSANAAREAWSEYFAAASAGFGSLDRLAAVGNKYEKYLGGQWAMLRLADQRLESGVNQLFFDRTNAQISLDSAVDWYSRVAKVSSDRDLRARATLGVARCYESLNRLDEASAEYESVIKQWPSSEYAAEARQRREQLDQPASRDFYAWFAAQKVSPPSRSSSLPGSRPSFDFDALPKDAPSSGSNQSPAP